MRHLEGAKSIWSTYVPARGQADTVQGELLRAVQKLRDEAVRNGNLNWDEGHELLARFLASKLGSSEVFGPEARAEIERNLEIVRNPENPADDRIYDELADRVVEWCLAHPDPVPHEHDPTLRR